MSGGHFIRDRGPCSNCGRDDGAIMVAHGWGHSWPCCSRACGVRLGKKIEHGMGDLHPNTHAPWDTPITFDEGAHRALSLRIRIKQLQAQLKAAREVAA